MGCIGCCEGGCCTNPDEPIFEMDFSSPDGLHPVSFTNAPLRVAKYTQPAFPIVPGFDRQPPSNLQNGSCPWPGSSTAEWFEAGSRSVGPDVKEDCCWAAIAIPSSYALSPPVIYKYRWAFESTVVNDKLYRSTFNRTCTTAGFEWQGSTRTRYFDTVEKRQRIAQRYVFAVGIKACWVDGQTVLTARVWYKDWERFLRTSFYRERFISSGATTYTGFRTDLGFCGPKTDLAASDNWICGSGTRPAEFEYVEGLAVENCFDCNSSTSPNFSHNPPNCNLDYVDRAIVLNSEICDISGTYVFESGLSPSVKFADGLGCLTSTILDCAWLYRTPKCSVEDSVLGEFIQPINETKPLVGNVDFDEFDEVQTVDTTETVYEDGPTTLMYWWTEPWTITIR